MFSKINGEFTKHAKGFQIILGLMIVVPFVIMIPNTDIFGPGYVSETPDKVGTISGKDIAWENYEKEARRFLISESISGFGLMQILRQGQSIILEEGLREGVLKYMAKIQEMESQADAGKFNTEISNDDIKTLIKDTFSTNITTINAISRGQLNLDVKQALELLRYNLKVGGAEIDEVMNRIILMNRFEDSIKEKAEVKDEDVLARIQKEEKIYSVRTAEVDAGDYKNEPLKDYYEKNKDLFFDKDAVKASIVVFDPQKYKTEILKTDLTAEIEKAFEEEKKTNDQAEKNAKTIKERLKDRIVQDKAREKAMSMANLIETNLKAKVKPEMKTTEILKAFSSLAKASKLDVQESSFHSKKNVEKSDHPINSKVTGAILTLSEKSPITLLDDQSKFYVLVFNAKGYFQPIEQVREQLLKAVYNDKAADYYNENMEDFKLEHRVKTGFIQLYGGLFRSEVSISPEEAQKIYDADSSYQSAQKKLMQFSYELKADAKEEDKKAAVAALEIFLKENGSKTAEELQKLDLGKDSKIKRIPLSWTAENDLRTGTDKEIVTEAFKTADGKFTKVFEREKFAAVVFVEASRESTPFDEVKQGIIGTLRTERLKEITSRKADELLRKLQGLKEKNPENVAAIIKEFADLYKTPVRTLDEIPAAENLNNQFAQQFIQPIAQRNGISPNFVFDLSSLSSDRLFTRVKSMPNMAKAIGYLIEDLPAGYQTLEEVLDIVYNRLNDEDAEKIASDKAAAIKQELEAAVEKPEDFKTLMSKNDFKEVKEVKVKDADPTIAKILEASPKAKEFGSNPAPNGRVTTLAYIESVKEVSEEDIAKVKAEYEKKIKDEVEQKELEDFWANTMKKYDVKALQSSKES